MAAVEVGREVEAFAAAVDGAPSADFVDGVMAAIGLEPAPAPVALAEEALRAGRLTLAIAAMRDAWRVALSGPRPLAMRAQGAAFALVVLLALGSTVGLAAGAFGFNPFQRAPSVASPSPAPTAPVPPTPSPSIAPPASPSPSASPTPTHAQPTGTPERTDDHGGPGSGRTPRPTATDDHSGPGGGGGSGSSGSGGSGSSGSANSGKGGG